MLNKLTGGLLWIIIIELIFGGGRLINFGPISLRMILFAMALVVSSLHLLKGNRIETKYVYLIVGFTSMLGIGITVGIFSGADKKLIWEDVKPLMFFYLLPFFHFAITKESDLIKIGRTIIVGATVMAFVFLTVLLLISTDSIKFLDFYNLAFPTGEFFFRGEYSFFYKGFIYLCIGFLFVHLTRSKNLRWLLAILLIAIFLSFTRGLILALGLTYAVYYLFIKQFYARTILACMACGVILFFGKDLYGSLSHQLYQMTASEKKKLNSALSEKLLGDREFSDNERKRQITQVAHAVTLTSLAWGHGFGNGVPSRPVHMEISCLEIFHKQGLLGIACWGFIFFSLGISYKNGMRINSDLGTAFFLSSVFIFSQSLTNQYMNNPIGMGMLLIAQVSLDVLAKKN